MLAVNWDAVSSVSAVAASIIAIIAIVATVVLYVRQRSDEQAAQIREDIRSFTGASSRLHELLRDGSPLIAASWESALALRSQLDPGASAAEAEDLLRCEGMGLSIVVAGWGKAAQASDLRAAAQDILMTSRRLSGDLNVLSEAGDLLRGISADMSMAYVSLLADGTMVSMFLAQTKERSLPRFLTALSTNVHANTAGYFSLRYSDAIAQLDDFIVGAAEEFSRLGARQLVAVSQSKSPVAGDGEDGGRSGSGAR